jgi:hypothetical protein
MPFDPAQPASNSALSSQVMRDQLNSLNDLIAAILTITAAQVDGVSTLNPGDPATVGLSVAGSTLHFTFGIPRGNEGVQGNPGNDGPQGPPFAQAIIDGVNTLNPGDNATVSVSFDGSNVRFTFGIPRGNDGSNGNDGGQGPAGPQGPPGEVTAADLANAISSTSANSNGVPTMDVPFSNDPPSLTDIETMRAAYNTLVLGLRR